MSEFIAESTIIVNANTKPFKAQVLAAIKEAEKTKVTIPVTASGAGFRKSLIEQVRIGSKGVTAPVLVTPNLTGFSAKLRAAVKAAARGVTVPVAVAPAKAAAATGAASAEKATAQAIQEETAALQALEVQLHKVAVEKSLVATQENAVKRSTVSVTSVIKEQIAELELQAAALHKVTGELALQARAIKLRNETAAQSAAARAAAPTSTAGAAAGVPIQPNPAGFREKLIADVRAAAKGLVVPIPIVVDPTGFRSRLVAQVQLSAKGVVAKIGMVPDPKGFRTALVAAAKLSAKGVTVPVSATPVKGAPGAAAPAAAAAAVTAAPVVSTVAETTKETAAVAKLTKAQRLLVDAENAAAFARKKVIGEMTAQEKSMAILDREAQSLVAAQKALNAAVVEGNVALEGQARALVKSQGAAVTARQGVIARRQAQIDAPQQAAEQARGQTVAQVRSIETERVALVARGEAAGTKIIETEAAKRLQIEEAFAARETELRTERLAAVESALAKETAAEVSAGQKILSARAAAEEKADKKSLSLRTRAAELRRQASVLPAPTSLTTGEEITRARKEADAIQRAAKTGANAARTAGLPALEREFETIKAENIALQEQLALQRRLVNLRKSVQKAALPATGKTEELRLSRQAAANAKAAAEAELLEADARKVNASAIATESAALGEQAVIRKGALGGLAESAAATARQARASKDATRAIQSQAFTFAGLRGAALSAESPFLIAAAATIAFVKALQTTASLESTLNTFKVTASATADEMVRVSATAKQLGADITLPGVNATDAATALTELSKAGLSVQDSIDGARGVLQLATAAAIDNQQATELAASALNAFGLAGDQAVHVADVLANAANASQGSIVDIGIALQQSAAVARQAGLSLEQTVGVLTLFARAGLKGSDAGTSLRTMLIRLINPTAKARKEINELGLNLRTANGSINIKVFDQFAKATQGMTRAERDQILAVIAGQDAIRGAAILARTGASALDSQVAGLNKSGTAAALASARMAGMAGAVENLKNQLTTLGLAFGQLLAPFITTSLKLVTKFASSLAEAADGALQLANALKKIRPPDLPSIPDIGPIGTSKDSVTGDFARRFGGKAIRIAFQVQTSGPAVTLLRGINKLLDDTEKQSKRSSDVVRDAITSMGIATLKFGADSEEAQKQVTPLLKTLTGFARTAAGVETVKNIFADMSPAIKKALEDGVIDPAERATLATTALGQAFLAFLGTPLPGTNIGAKIASDIEDAGAKAKAAASPFGPELSEIFARNEGMISTRARQVGEGVGDNLVGGLKTGFFKALAVARQGMQQLNDELNRAVIAGAGPGQQNQILQQQVQVQKDRIAAANKRLAEIDPTDQTKGAKQARTAARSTISDALEQQRQITEQIRGNNEQVQSDKEQAANDIKNKRDKADQKFLDALGLGRRPAERAVARAQATEGADDNIQTLLAFRKRLNAEVVAVGIGVKDIDTKTKALQALSDLLFQNTQDLNAARKTRDEAVAQALAEKGPALVSLGETTGNTRLIIQGLDIQIAQAKEMVVKARAAKLGQAAAAAALAELQKQKRDTINTARNALLDAAFSVAEARGNKSVMLQILDLQIEQAKREQAQAKTLLDRYTAMAKVAELVNKKKEILADELDKDKQGTTVFDILQKGVAAFNASAGNLINADQPFAGPAGFNADISQFLKFGGRSATGAAAAAAQGGGINPFQQPLFRGGTFAGRPFERQQMDLTGQLIEALKGLTEATLSQGGNKSTAVDSIQTKVKGNPWAGRRWFGWGQDSRLAQDS